MTQREENPVLLPIIWICLVIGLGGFAVLVFWAGWQSLAMTAKPAIHDGLTGFVTGVGGALATNFGATLGVSEYINRNLLAPFSTGGLSAAVVPQRWLTLQVIAAWVYFVTLLAAGAFWILDGFSSNTADLVRNMAATFGGVVVGILIVRLNIKPK